MKTLLTAMVALGICLATARPAAADTEVCGDLDGNGSTVSSDALLLLLRFAIGQQVSIQCPAVSAVLRKGRLQSFPRVS